MSQSHLRHLANNVINITLRHSENYVISLSVIENITIVTSCRHV